MRRLSRSRGPALSLAAAVLLFSGPIACTAEKTAPGEAPTVDVDVDPGRWPEYKVNWADVDVGTRERTVTVPVVQVTQETRQIQVPYIDINPPGARDREERTVHIEVDAPHAGYELQITQVRASGDDLWVVGQLREANASAAQRVTRLADQVIVNAPADLDVRKVIVGTRLPGGHNEQHRFVDSIDALNRMIPQSSRVLYQRPSQS